MVCFQNRELPFQGHHWLMRPTELPKDLGLHGPLRKQNIESAGVWGLQGDGMATQKPKPLDKEVLY